MNMKKPRLTATTSLDPTDQLGPAPQEDGQHPPAYSWPEQEAQRDTSQVDPSVKREIEWPDRYY